MNSAFHDFYEKNEKQLIENLIRLIQIPSVAGSGADSGSDPGAPFGKDVQEALQYMLSLGAEMGFAVRSIGGYVGEITMGEGDHLIGILCHADVVDAGSGWNTNAFDGTIIDGRLYGRGAIDDKGPMISCLYAMKYIQEQNLLPGDTRIRMIIGTDEEENWISMKEYLKRDPEIPEVSIVPDANFPVIFCEKGLINLKLRFPFAAEKDGIGLCVSIESLSGGERPNVVAAESRCVLSCASPAFDPQDMLACLHQISERWPAKVCVEDLGGGRIRITVSGKPAHAMTPEKGINAISYMLMLLYHLTQTGTYHIPQAEALRTFARYFSLEYNGASLGICCQDDDSGSLTVNVGLMELQSSALVLQLNIRYPVSETFAAISAAVTRICCQAGASAEYGVCMDPVRFRRDSAVIQKLMAVYQRCSGDTSSEAISLGGATFARAIPGAVAFGPVFPDQEELAHEANEYFALSDYRRITEIYAEALLSLCER